MSKPGPKDTEDSAVDIVHAHSGGRLVGGLLSEVVNYSDLFIRTRDAIFLLDPENFKILECNPSVQQILGVSPDKVQGDCFLKWIHPSAQESAQDYLQRGARSKRAETTFVCEMGNGVVFELSVCGLKLADYGKILQVIAKDVTEIRLIQQELEKTNQRLQEISVTDEMTQVGNFRHFMKELEKEHNRSERYKTQYSIIFCDVDHFKHYNDTNGHPAGDETLKKVAGILKERVRKADLCARYGGEEFVVLCPNTSVEQTVFLAETLRKAIEAQRFAFGEKQPLGKVTISMGVASYPDHGGTAKEVLQAADAGVYASKHGGRNRVTAGVKASGSKGKKAS